MDWTSLSPVDEAQVGASAEPIYRVVLTMPLDARAERRLRHLVERKRGELKSLLCTAPRYPSQVHLYLGIRRIDDVVSALEGAGFAIDAVVATRERLPSRCSLATPSSRRPNARSSNL